MTTLIDHDLHDDGLVMTPREARTGIRVRWLDRLSVVALRIRGNTNGNEWNRRGPVRARRQYGRKKLDRVTRRP